MRTCGWGGVAKLFLILFAGWLWLRVKAAGTSAIGVTAVLHTWGQKLGDHYHLHCIVTGGGWAGNGSGWVSSGRHYLFPIRALSKN